MRSARALGITTIAIYSDEDKGALHTRVADEAYSIGGISPQESYLNQNTILRLARDAKWMQFTRAMDFYRRTQALQPSVNFTVLPLSGQVPRSLRKWAINLRLKSVCKHLVCQQYLDF